MDSGRDGWRKWIPVLEGELVDEMRKAPAPSDAHGMDHVRRVRERCIKLGIQLDADLEVLTASVYLHDLGRHYVSDEAHGPLSARKAEPILERIDFPKEKRGHVLYAIRVHDVSATPMDRNTLESKILYDADKIDTVGAIGVLRYIRHFYGKKPIDYILDAIEARWEGLALPETRKMALKDYEYVKDYFLQLKAELRE